MRSTHLTSSHQLSKVRPLTRRKFLGTTANITAGLSFLSVSFSAAAAARNKSLPKPKHSGLNHVVLVMMENRSFDHFLGWTPGANGRQAGLMYPDRSGQQVATWSLDGNYQGCQYQDPDHSYQGGRTQYAGGNCDGWLLADSNDIYPIGYYTAQDLDFFRNAVPAWTTCDNYFAPFMGPTYSNRIYQHAAQTDRLDDSLLPLATLPTIWDRLADHSLPAKYYFSDFPFLALWGTKYLGISRPIAEFFADCVAGTLPAVSFVEPRFLLEDQGLSGDDHPHADIRNGEAFLNSVYSAIISSPNWRNTLLIINYDEWGGFFDHVAPMRAPIPPADAALGSDGLRGFRVPAMLVSPFARRGYIATGLYDHTSVLKLIEWRWHLRPLTIRDSTANNLAHDLDFEQPNTNAPVFTVPPGLVEFVRAPQHQFRTMRICLSLRTVLVFPSVLSLVWEPRTRTDRRVPACPYFRYCSKPASHLVRPLRIVSSRRARFPDRFSRGITG